MTDEWFYKRGEAVFGPVSGVMLHDLVQRGRLLDHVLVRRGGSENWMPVSEARTSLPPVPEVSPPVAGENHTHTTFDSSLPGASIVYAPPRAALKQMAVSTSLPTSLSMALVVANLFLILSAMLWLVRGLATFCDMGPQSSSPEWLQEPVVVLRHILHPATAFSISFGKLFSLIIWQGCAFSSVRRLYGDSMVRHGPASGFWWIVPIANFFMPLFCLRELRYLSRTRRNIRHPHPRFGPILWVIGVVLVGNVVLTSARWISRLNNKGYDAGEDFASWTDLLHAANGMALPLVLLTFVNSNYRQQCRLHHYWNDDAHWKVH